MPVKSMDELYLMHLKLIYDGEKQITKALPKMAKKAQAQELKQAFMTHLEETKGQIERLEQVFDMLDEKPAGKTNKALKAIITEADEMFGKMDKNVIDACMIACAQLVEHYEIATYGTLCAMARQCGCDDQAELLEETLDEEKATDEKLTDLAEDDANERAENEQDEDEDEEREEAA